MDGSKEWNEIPGFKEYEVTSDGRVRKKRSGRIIKSAPGSRGYLILQLRNDEGCRKMALLHRIVTSAFVPNPQGLPTVNHKDFDKLNNNADNLEWMTRGDNCRHAQRAGRWPDNRGRRPIRAKLTNEQVRMLRKDRSIMTLEQLSERYGICTRTISSIVSRRYYADVT